MTTTDVKIILEAEDRASAVVDGLRRQFRALQRDLARSFKPNVDAIRRSFAVHADRQVRRDAAAAFSSVAAKIRLQQRMYRQRAAEEKAAERARRQAFTADLRTFRQRMAFSTRIARQRAEEERQGEREHLARVRRLEREHGLARRYAVGRAGDALGYGRGTVDRLTRGPAIAAGIGAAGAGLAARRILTTEADVDSAQINAQIYGGLTREAVRELRNQWAAPLAEQLGSTTAGLLKAFTDAQKVGVEAEGARAFAELSTKTSEAWELPFETVTDVLGTINSILTSGGAAFSFDRLKSVANAMQHLAAKMSTTPEKMISFMQRGAGASQLLGMSQEAGLAFGAASTSLGNEAGSSGRMFDYIAGRITSLPRIMRGKGEDAKDANKLLRSLGYGGIAGLRAKQRENPDEFVFDFIERFNKIQDTTKRNEAIRFFAGQEWLGEFGRMVTGSAKVREAQKLAKESKNLDAIGDVWSLHQTKLAFVFKQFRAGFLNILGEFGTVLSPIARQVGDYFLRWSQELRGGGLQARFKAAMDGFVEGLGFRDVPDLLKGIFGEPGKGDAGSIASWGKFAKGFAAGIRDVGEAIVASLKAISGGSSDPEVLGRWAARIMGFSVALRAASPAIDILKGLGAGILAVAQTILAAWGTLKVVRAIGALGAVGGAGAAVAGTVGLPIVIAGLAGIAALAVTIMNWDAIRSWFKGAFSSGTPDADKSPIEKPKADLKWWEMDPLLHRQSYDAGGDYRAMIRKAAFGDLADSVERLGSNVGRLGASIQMASVGTAKAFTGSSFGSASPSISGSMSPTGAGDPARQFGRSFFTPGFSPPAWMGTPRPGTGRDAARRASGGTLPPDSPVAPFKGSQTFDSMSPRIMGDLQRDFGLGKEDAAAILGNLGHESGGFRFLQELKPMVPGSRGGWGWAQWTGPRRRAFERYAAERGLDPKSYEANYGFLRHELKGDYAKTLERMKSTPGLGAKTRVFENGFERAGIKHYASREKWARRAMTISPETVAGLKPPQIAQDGRSGLGGSDLQPPASRGPCRRPRASRLGIPRHRPGLPMSVELPVGRDRPRRPRSSTSRTPSTGRRTLRSWRMPCSVGSRKPGTTGRTISRRT
ncbi:phage tail tape measure protein [Enterovirga aerilata]|uniref:Phage tail tape measure protein n=1 Tax=Enterovirga aerilata TaxID=2730920 RepID=A0A849I7Z5_9HYPH|nr:phage tail tape measure protein [Enterovirga sp. DB1703]NNM72415.1 phage tail tape measure protein [Enterovirga sp. DB1703]